MKLLHTGDWHLGDRQGPIDRTDDLRRAVERVAEYCQSRDIEVLLVAGDLFSERCRSDGLRDAIAHLHRVFGPFLQRGGTIVSITGNHDNETFCRTLCHAMNLAVPAPAKDGELLPCGRFYLADTPTFYRLKDRAGQAVQFVLLPYPTASRYLTGSGQPYGSLEDKHRALAQAYLDRLDQFKRDPAFDATVPSVLSAHVNVRGTTLANLFRISEDDDIVISHEELARHWCYVGLGHIHRPQALAGLAHLRYSGSIERLDLGERNDSKSVVEIEIGAKGLFGEPLLLPLDATPFYDIPLTHPSEDLPRLRMQYEDAERALVRCQISYRSGIDDLSAILREVHAIFPRCYQCEPHNISDPTAVALAGGGAAASVRTTVVDYLREQLAEHKDLEEVLKLAEALLVDEEPK